MSSAAAAAAAMVFVTLLGAWPPSSKKTTYIEIWTKMTFFECNRMGRRAPSHRTQKSHFGPYLVIVHILYLNVSSGFSRGRKILNLVTTGQTCRFMISNFEFRIPNHTRMNGTSGKKNSHVHGRIIYLHMGGQPPYFVWSLRTIAAQQLQAARARTALRQRRVRARTSLVLNF